MTAAERVSAVVVTFNSAASIGETLRALLHCDLSRVIVVDNASGDGTTDIVEAMADARVLLLRRDDNVGFGAAVNEAVARVTSDYVLVLNPDCTISSPALAALVDYLNAHPACAITAPALVDAQGTSLSPSGSAGTLATELKLAVPRRLAWMFPDRRHDPAATRSGPVGYVEGACMLMRRHAFVDVGGFDSGFFLFFEEMDVAERLRRSGWTVDLCLDASARHDAGGSRRSVAHEARPHYVHATVRYLRKHRGARAAAVYRAVAGRWWRHQARTGRLDPSAAAEQVRALVIAPAAPRCRLRSLLVVTESPWPSATGGARRVQALAATLDTVSDVTVLAALRTGQPLEAPAAITTVRVDRDSARWRSLVAMVGCIARGEPLAVAFYRRRRVRRALRSLLAEWAPHVVVTHEIGGPGLCRAIVPGDAMVLDVHNAEHELFADVARRLGRVRGLQWRLDAPRLARWAASTFPRAHAVLVPSPHDLQSYRRLAPDARLLLAPNGAWLPAAPRPDPGGARLLFVADLGYPPNADGLSWFVDEVLPLLASDIVLHVAGRGAVPAHPRVHAAGFVPDLAVEWAAATVAVVPLRVGGGSRLKVLEALAAGVPVVSTSVGAAGVDIRPGRDVLLADDAQAFADAVTRLVADPGLRTRIGSAGHRLARERYSWEHTLSPLRDLVAALNDSLPPQ